METSDVTVGIACFNQTQYLLDAITSARSQKPVSTIVVVDDGSTEGDPAAICHDLPGVQLVRQANAGLSAARNTALLHSTTPFILFLDADDVLRPGAMDAAVLALRADSDAALAYGGYARVDSKRRTLWNALPVVHRDPYEGLLEINYIAMHGTVLYRRERLLAVGGFDSALTACEDYDVYLKLARNHPFASYDAIAAEYREHDDNMTRNPARMLEQSLRVLQRHAPPPSELRLWEAYQRGLTNWRNFYSPQLAAEVVRKLLQMKFSRAFSDLRLGLRCDPRFTWRVFGRISRALSTSSTST